MPQIWFLSSKARSYLRSNQKNGTWYLATWHSISRVGLKRFLCDVQVCPPHQAVHQSTSHFETRHGLLPWGSAGPEDHVLNYYIFFLLIELNGQGLTRSQKWGIHIFFVVLLEDSKQGSKLVIEILETPCQLTKKLDEVKDIGSEESFRATPPLIQLDFELFLPPTWSLTTNAC